MAISTPIKDIYEGLVNFEYPECLYHYTTFDALKSIVESRLFRATHRSYLNDKVDLSSGLSVCMGHVSDWINVHNGDERKIGEEVLKKLKETANNISASPFSYSASFTEEGDGVVPWQLYGRYGRGIAICLGSERLKDCLREADFFDTNNGEITAPHFFLNRIEYDQRIQKEQVVQLLDAGVVCWPNARKFFPVSPEERIAHPVSFYLDLLSNRTFKHPGYIYEREWKAIPNVAGQEFVKFHATKSAMRPYIEMAFEPSCIQSIMVGSSAPFEDAKRSLELFLKQHELYHVEITRSEILLAPYDE